MYPQIWKRQFMELTPEQLANPNEGVDKNISQILGVAVGSIVLVILSVAVRFMCRLNRKMQLLADDWVMFVAMLFTIADAAAYIWGLRWGFGKHIWTLQPSDGVNFGKLVFVTFQLYGGAVTMIKISMLLFYDRVFGKKYRKWLIVLGVLSICWWIVISLASAFQCTPVAKAWIPDLPGTCIPYLNIFIGIQVTNIALDIAILVLPISAVMGLQMSKTKKYGVVGTFLLGGLSIVFAAVRLYILIRDQNQVDVSFDTATANWSLVEPAFELFCACLPCFAPLLLTGTWLNKLKTSLYGSRSSGSTGTPRYGSGNKQQFSPINESKRSPSSFASSAFTNKKTNLSSQNSVDDEVPLRQFN